MVRLGDVVGGVGQKDDPRAGVPGGVGQQAMAGGARGGGQSGGRLVAGPVQTPPVGVDRPGGRFGERVPAGAVRVQTVIDGERQQGPSRAGGPVGGEMQKGDGIPAAGQGDGDGPGGVTLQPVGQARLGPPEPVRDGIAQPGLRAAAGAAQAKRVRISVARVRSAGVAVGA